VWRTVRKTGKRILWIVVILLVAVLAGGAYLWSKCDELLHDAIVTSVKNWAPEVKVEFGRCRLDWFGSVHVERFSLTLPDEDEPFINLPDTIVDIDREALIQRQEVVIESLRLVRPRLEVTRHADGSWSFQALPPLPKSNKRFSLPKIVLEKAQVTVHVEHPTGEGQTTRRGTVLLDDVNFTFTPNGKRNFLVDGDLSIDQVGKLKLQGRLNVDSKTGMVVGRLSGVRIGRDLMTYASTIAPSIASQVGRVEQMLRDEMLKEPDPKQRSAYSFAGIARKNIRQNQSPPNSTLGMQANAIQEVAAVGAEAETSAFPHRIPVEWIGAENSVLGLMADLDVDFKIEKPRTDETPRLRLIAKLSNGELTTTALPFPLVNVTSTIEVTNEKLVLQNFSGSNGPTHVKLSGTVFKGEKIPTGKIKFKAENVVCDQRLRDRLSIATGAIYEKINPHGFYDIELSFSERDGRWKSHDFVMTTKNGGAVHQDFPYPVTNARGTVRQQGRDLYVTMNGIAGGQPVSLNGFVKNLGANSWSRFEIGLNNIPIDQTLLDAAPPGFRKTVNVMNLRGQLDGTVVFEKRPGSQKTVMKVDGELKNAGMLYEDFPYYADRLNGKITFDGRDWHFKDIIGFHDRAKLTTNGTFANIDGQTVLDISIQTENAPIDKALYDALSKPLKQVWMDYRPSGTIKKSVCKVHWVVGQPAEIRLPVVEITDGTALAKAFPYPLTDITATYEWNPGRLDIHSFVGKHKQTDLSAKAVVELQPNGDWLFRISPFKVVNLFPDDVFLNALQPGVRDIFSAFEKSKIIHLAGVLVMRGVDDPRVPVTAGWHAAIDLTGGDVSLGMDFYDVQGRIISKGSWDGYNVNAVGSLDLTRASVQESLKLRLHDIRGPFRVANNEFIGGSEAAFSGMSNVSPILPKDQITAKFIGGVLTTNVFVPLGEGEKFDLRVNLSHGELERFDQLYLRSRERLRGRINGWLRLAGTDEKDMTGRGQLQISPAAIYKLPLVFQMLKSLQFTGNADDSAFTYARADYRIAKQQFLFDAIDFVGPQLQLQGYGAADFEGRLNLTFASKLPQSVIGRPRISIPLVREAAGLFSGVTDLVGVAVQVTGTFENPKTNVLPGKNLDDAVKRFIDSLTLRPLTPPAMIGSPLGTPRVPGRRRR
jgi:hypothetical protein